MDMDTPFSATATEGKGWWEFTSESSGEKAGGEEEEAKQEEKQLVTCFH